MPRRDRTLPSEPAPDTFTDTLARVFGIARKAEGDDELRAALRSELQSLPGPARERVSALLNLGRKAHNLARQQANPAANDAAPLDALSLCDAHTLSRQYLERGLAAARAGKLPLDGSAEQTFGEQQRVSVYERAWSRFGRELASSEPGEWTWFACCKGRSRVLDELYVRHGKGAWWSFSAGLDRPLRGQIDDARRRAADTRLNSQGSSLESLLDRTGSPHRRALHRALSSVHARLGKVNGDPTSVKPQLRG